MAKGSLQYDPETMEFRRKDRGAPWADAVSAPVDRASDAANSPASMLEAEPDPDAGSEGVAKPEGYVDPTTIRRRRRRKRRSSSRSGSQETASAWRGIMWGIILVMAVAWAYMLFIHGQSKPDDPGEEPPFIIDRDDVMGGN